MSDAVWFAGKGGQQQGPFTEEDVQAKLASGEIKTNDLLWKEGMDQWKKAAEIEEFAEAVKSAPPLPPPQPAGPNPFAELLKGALADLKAMVADPDKGTTAVAAKRQLCFPVIWIVLGIIITALLALHTTSFERGSAFGRGLLYGAMGGWGLIDYAVFYGITILAVVPILRTKANWIDVFSIIGLAAIPTVVFGLLAFILLWAHSFFGVFIGVGVVLNLLIFAHVFQQVTQLTWRVTLYLVPAIFLAQAVVNRLVVLAFR